MQRTTIAGLFAALLLIASPLRAAAPATAPAMVSLQFTTPRGGPAAGARITLVGYDEARDAQALAEAVADQRGIARLPLIANTYILTEADGCGVAAEPMRATDAIIHLRPANTATLTFVGADGRPVAGLDVEPILVTPDFENPFAAFAGMVRLPPDARRRLARRTDENGSITFDRFAPSQQIELSVADDRWAEPGPDDRLVTSQSETTPAKTIRLQLSGSIRGTVQYGRTGRPAVGVRVAAQSLDVIADDGRLHSGWGDAVTDDRGRYEIRRLPPTRYNVAIDCKSNGIDHDWTAVARADLAVSPGARLDGQDLSLIPGVVVRGVAVDADDGKPLPGTEIGIYGPAHPRTSAWVQGTTCDAAGRFTARVPPGPQHVYPMSDVAGHGNSNAQNLNVADGSPVDVRFEYPRALTRGGGGGVVRRADGSPAAGATVLVQRPWMPKGSDNYTEQVEADAAGRFHVDVAPVGTHLRARTADGGSTATAVRVGLVKRDQIDLTLAPGRTEYDVTVQVVGPDRKPIPAATVELIDGGTIGHPEHQTDAQGRYRFDALYPDESYSVGVSADGFESATAQLVGAVPGKAGQARELMLDRASGTIAGRVVDGPKPWDGVWVALRGGRRTQWTTTDAAGHFRFDHVDGTDGLTLRGQAPWGNSAWQSVAPGAADVQLSFPTTRPSH